MLIYEAEGCAAMGAFNIDIYCMTEVSTMSDVLAGDLESLNPTEVLVLAVVTKLFGVTVDMRSFSFSQPTTANSSATGYASLTTKSHRRLAPNVAKNPSGGD
jgi:hypothetical protein